MVEMLIVVAVLGILAAALLATIDPFEQMKKAQDTTMRNAVVDIYDSITRFYGTNGDMPWGSDNGIGGDCDGAISPNYVDLTDTGANACIAGLQTRGELKPDFLTQLGAAKQSRIILDLTDTTGADITTARVCFQPDSKTIRGEPNTKYCDDGSGVLVDGSSGGCAGGGSCPDPTVNTCYWCIY